MLEDQKGRNHLNADELLERVGGDRTFLSELADVFRQDYPKRLRAIRTALAQNDAAGLRRSSHELKGALSNLAAPQAREAVATLEAIGASCDLTGADAVLSGLETEIQQVVESLDALCREPAL
jgi:HPt (histidine-containing phosphotransfer) domain-containing protein